MGQLVGPAIKTQGSQYAHLNPPHLQRNHLHVRRLRRYGARDRTRLGRRVLGSAIRIGE